MAGTKGAKWGVEREVLALLRSSTAPLTVREIVAETGRSQYAVQNQLGALCATGRAVRQGRGGPRTPWRYTIDRDAGDTPMTGHTPAPPPPTEAELAAMRAEYERALPWIAAPWDEWFPRLFALADECLALRAQRETAAPLLDALGRAATETYMGANEELLLMAKGRALDRLIALWEQVDAAASATGERGDADG